MPFLLFCFMQLSQWNEEHYIPLTVSTRIKILTGRCCMNTCVAQSTVNTSLRIISHGVCSKAKKQNEKQTLKKQSPCENHGPVLFHNLAPSYPFYPLLSWGSCALAAQGCSISARAGPSTRALYLLLAYSSCSMPGHCPPMRSGLYTNEDLGCCQGALPDLRPEQCF